MKLTVDNLRAAYAYLAETEPFVGWNMPDAEDVRFVVENKAHHGKCDCYKDGSYRISINGPKHTHTQSLMLTMAHEMVHVHEYQAKLRVTTTKHGKVFRLLANEVCEAHGFDPGQF